MIESLYQDFLKTQHISIDTRKIVSGSIFFALKGNSFDGNQFAERAITLGAKKCVVDNFSLKKNKKFYVVDNVLDTLQNLAKYHRKKLQIPIIGITGSNGKTTTKELIAKSLSPKYKVFATQGNYNNHIGVPISILSINNSHNIAVIEMGANHVGEIENLCNICQPTHGAITNIGKAHLEGFGGKLGVLKGKSELYRYLKKTNGKIFINSNDQKLCTLANDLELSNVVYYPNKTDNIKIVDSNPYLSFQFRDEKIIQTKITGKYNIENISTALAFAIHFDVPTKLVTKEISNYKSNNNRSELIKKGSNLIILDAYNSNPTSVRFSISNLSEQKLPKKIAIIGDMNELGNQSNQEHILLGKELNNRNFDEKIFCGKLIKPASQHCKDSTYFQNTEELVAYLKKRKFKDSAILIKGSRNMKLELLIQYF